MSEARNLDPAALERLQRLGGPAFVVKMISLFLSYTAEKIAEARAAQLAGDLAGVAKAAHPLKSSAANVGADHMQELARRLETLAGQGQGDGLASLVGELEQSYAAIKPELEEKKKKALSGPSP